MSKKLHNFKIVCLCVLKGNDFYKREGIVKEIKLNSGYKGKISGILTENAS